MKRTSPSVAARWRATLAIIAIVLASACARRDPAPDRVASAPPPPSSESFSVYDLPGEWHDQSGAARTIAAQRGAPVLVAMIYTHCTATCPLAVAELKRVAALDSSVRFVLVTLDPARDDPDRLARYGREHALDPSRWTLLTGNDQAVRDLAATLGVRYRRVTPDDLAHSNLITLLDAEGRIVRQTSGRLDVAEIATLHAPAR